MPKKQYTKRPTKRTAYDKFQDKVMSKLKKLTKPEQKYILTSGSASPDNTGSVAPLTFIAQGTDETQRIGMRISPRYFDIRYYWNMTAGVLVNTRLIIFRWHEDPNTNPPTMATILGAGGDPTLNPPNPLSKSQYEILYDKAFYLSAAGTPAKTFVFRKRLPLNKQIYYQGNGNTAASALKNHIYVLVVSDAAPAGNTPNVAFQNKILYTDV